MQTIQEESEQKLMDLMWVTWVNSQLLQLTLHLLTKLCLHPTAPWAVPLNPFQLRWLKVTSSRTQFCCSVHMQNRQKHSSHDMRSSPGCWPRHQLHFLSYHTTNEIPAEQQPGKSGRGQRNKKHSPSFLLTNTSHCEPHTPHRGTHTGLGACLVSCLHHTWYPPQSTKPDNFENVGTISKTFQCKKDFPHGNECFSD